MEAETVFTLSAWRDAMTHVEQPCPLCHDAVGFHHESYIPIELGCGHIICCECLGLAFERQIDTEFRCHCPLCPSGFIYAIHPDRTKTAVTHFRYDWMGQFIEVSIALHNPHEQQTLPATEPTFTFPTPPPSSPAQEPFPAFDDSRATPGPEVDMTEFFDFDFDRYHNGTPAPEQAPPQAPQQVPQVAENPSPPTQEIQPVPAMPDPSQVPQPPLAEQPVANAQEPQQTVRRSGRCRALTERGRKWQEEIAKRRTRRR